MGMQMPGKLTLYLKSFVLFIPFFCSKIEREGKEKKRERKKNESHIDIPLSDLTGADIGFHIV
jgi:hypothetical protein